jgi:hypothetical protein
MMDATRSHSPTRSHRSMSARSATSGRTSWGAPASNHPEQGGWPFNGRALKEVGSEPIQRSLSARRNMSAPYTFGHLQTIRTGPPSFDRLAAYQRPKEFNNILTTAGAQNKDIEALWVNNRPQPRQPVPVNATAVVASPRSSLKDSAAKAQTARFEQRPSSMDISSPVPSPDKLPRSVLNLRNPELICNSPRSSAASSMSSLGSNPSSPSPYRGRSARAAPPRNLYHHQHFTALTLQSITNSARSESMTNKLRQRKHNFSLSHE